MIFEPVLNEYLKFLAAKGFAKDTVIWRKVYAKRLLTYLAEKKNIFDLRAVTGSHLQDYLLYLRRQYRTRKGTRLADRTFQANHTTIVDFFYWLEQTGQILITPLANLPRPKSSKLKQLPHVLTEAETLQILESCPINTLTGLRDRAILELLYSTGIRRAELLNLDLADFIPERGELIIRQGKNRKDRIVPVGEIAVTFTIAYLKLIRPWLAQSPEEQALFLNSKGKRICPPSLKSMIGAVIRKSGVAGRVTPHTFRHTMATHLLRNKADLRHIQAILGHSSLQSTEVYTQVDLEDLKQAIKKAHPRGKRRALQEDSEPNQ